MHKTKSDIFIQGPIPATVIADTITKHGSRTDIGAHSLFLGQIRADEVAGKTVRSIEYTNNKELALQQMDSIRSQIFAKYDLSCMHVYHSEGIVHAGEICFFVFTSSTRRKAAMNASRELVERIKSELPIWGREIFEDESHQWKINN